jgi:tRNA(Ile)-lysidine synthase
MSTKLKSLEFRLFCRWQAELAGQRVLVTCSGGRDSVALVKCFARLAPRIGFELAIAHVHHGFSRRIEIQNARKQAQAFTEELADKLSLPIFVSVPGDTCERISEQDLRQYRLAELKKIFTSGGFTKIAFAHHADDLLETRLIRLIRGTGIQGLKAMSESSGKVIRPFLTERRANLEAYLLGQSWFEDPSNHETGPLRNWLRLSWLPELERKRAGSMKALERSLENISQHQPVRVVRREQSLDRRVLLQRSVSERRQEIASYVRAVGSRQFGSSHIDEVLKRVSSRRKRFEFEVAGLRWNIELHTISAAPVEGVV